MTQVVFPTCLLAAAVESCKQILSVTSWEVVDLRVTEVNLGRYSYLGCWGNISEALLPVVACSACTLLLLNLAVTYIDSFGSDELIMYVASAIKFWCVEWASDLVIGTIEMKVLVTICLPNQCNTPAHGGDEWQHGPNLCLRVYKSWFYTIYTRR